MLRFLFWNIAGKSLAGLIARIVRERDVDIVLLAESELTDREVVRQLNRTIDPRAFWASAPQGQRIKFYHRLPQKALQPLADLDRYSFRHLVPPIGLPILLVGVHLISRLRMDAVDANSLARRLPERVRAFETQVGHTRTVVVGDFNLDPFEPGMIESEGLHATRHRSAATRESRVVQGEDRRFFFNPMWTVYGAKRPAAPGTYYYDASGSPTNHYWNIFDQVLVRPSLINEFDEDALEIVTSVGGRSLLNGRGEPDSARMSDHLPIVFTLKN